MRGPHTGARIFQNNTILRRDTQAISSFQSQMASYGVSTSGVSYLNRRNDSIWIRDFGPMSIYDADTNGYVPVLGEARSARRKLFQQLDVRAEKTWLYDTWSLGVYLDVQNVLNIENVEATQFDYRYRESSPITSVPLVPTLGVRGRF